MRVHVEKARPDHLPPIMDVIRPADIREWYAGTGNPDIEAGLEYVFKEDRYARAAVTPEGRALCLWGLDPVSYSKSRVWMFATTEAEKRALSLHRVLQNEVSSLHREGGDLEAWSDSRNTKHHNWLEWLGFTFQSEFPMEPFGLPFKLYTRRQPCA